MPNISPYRVFACRYATREATRKEHFIDADANPDVSMPMDYFVWVAMNEDRTVVIDTGFDAEMAARRGRLGPVTSTVRRPGQAVGSSGGGAWRRNCRASCC